MWPFRKPKREWLTLADAAQRARITRHGILRAALRGELRLYIDAADYEQWEADGLAHAARKRNTVRNLDRTRRASRDARDKRKGRI
ncbi:MAG: hypothetical protein AB7O04_01670 [Hyphomonadaceae bacterium]